MALSPLRSQYRLSSGGRGAGSQSPGLPLASGCEPGSGSGSFRQIIHEAPKPPSASSSTPSGEFACDICGWTFRKRGNLNKHRANQHGPRRRDFTCQMCGLGFVERHNRDSHVRLVCGGAKPELCHICGTRFGRKSSLRQHIHTVHVRCHPACLAAGEPVAIEVHVLLSSTPLTCQCLPSSWTNLPIT
jgi:Zinc finger, C2H2 type